MDCLHALQLFLKFEHYFCNVGKHLNGVAMIHKLNALNALIIRFLLLCLVLAPVYSIAELKNNKLDVKIDSDIYLSFDIPENAFRFQDQGLNKVKELSNKIKLSYDLTLGRSAEVEYRIALALDDHSNCWFQSCRSRAIYKFISAIRDHIEQRERFARASFLFQNGKTRYPRASNAIQENERRFDSIIGATRAYFDSTLQNSSQLATLDIETQRGWLEGYIQVWKMYIESYQEVTASNILIAVAVLASEEAPDVDCDTAPMGAYCALISD